MKKGRGWIWLAVAACLAAGGGWWMFRSHRPGPAAGMPTGITYYCPMHPTITSDRPGDCPVCNMRLVPRAEEAPAGPRGGDAHAGPGREPEGWATVTLPEERQQLIGVRKARVARERLLHAIRAVGRVEVDETRVAVINTKFGGWIEALYVDYTGKFVEQGATLAAIYSPELVSTQEEYLIALRGVDRARTEGGDAAMAERLANGVRERLRLWDISEEQIQRLEKTRTPTKTLGLMSPIKGFVLEKDALKGKAVVPGEPLYRVADLSSVWVIAEVYEYELAHVHEGVEAEVEFSYWPGQVFRGTVTYVYPVVNPMSRTTKVRIELPNPDLALKPGMFANVRLVADMGRQLAVPREAVLDTGTRQIVFVERSAGTFEPREVRLGMRVQDKVEVLGGLREGEIIVTSGNFLLDSESRLRAATRKASPAAAPSGHEGHGR